MIYVESLVRGKIYITLSTSNNDDHRFDDRFKPYLSCWSPSHDRRNRLTRRYEDLHDHESQGIVVGLLQGVNKATQREAENVFYSTGNHFIVPVSEFEYPVDIGGNPGPVHRSLQYQSISYSFDMRHVNVDHYNTYRAIKEQYDSSHNGLFDDLTPDLKSSALHDSQKDDILEAWEDMCETITERMTLKFLQLDFENCYCPVGCCRMLEDVCKCLVSFPNGFPKRVEVMGLRPGPYDRAAVYNLIGQQNKGWVDIV